MYTSRFCRVLLHLIDEKTKPNKIRTSVSFFFCYKKKLTRLVSNQDQTMLTCLGWEFNPPFVTTALKEWSHRIENINTFTSIICLCRSTKKNTTHEKKHSYLSIVTTLCSHSTRWCRHVTVETTRRYVHAAQCLFTNHHKHNAMLYRVRWT